ncbi:hypothetical protein E4T50_04959 [Aureobasidium sp. EXF-12298]|nr:hypothetical protein E4T50_04959 [Aureobasidium sp. EXF-12298]KAI4762271.1 hypothetical protein E4T51_04737 [Aureobasidium sp. EXF-12344]KAI4771846.1 hypothetical protein E4T52_13159 [Aureobasidium sp. EXF-3400]
MTQYGKFHNFCRDTGSARSTLPLFDESASRGGQGFGGCELRGISLSGDRHLANLGSILIDGLAILIALFLIWRSNRKRAAVGRREMQLFLVGFIIISICEIFTIGWFPLNGGVRRAFSAVHIAAIIATTWILLMNAAVGYQFLDDGTLVSLALIFGSAAILFIGTGYIALDTGFSWTGYWDDTLVAPNRAYALYTLYQLVPLVFLFIFFVLEAFIVIRVLGEIRPLFYLIAAVLLFAIGQIFQYVISVHLCWASNGAINGGLFESLFTLLAIVMIWVFWSSITEDDWPLPSTETSTYN